MTEATSIPPELVERMVALVREAANMGDYGWNGRQRDEARAIVALLPEPVDPDLVLAGKVMAECGWTTDDPNYDAAEAAVLAAMERDRQLQREKRA